MAFSTPARPNAVGYRTHWLFPVGVPYRLLLNPSHGQLLTELAAAAAQSWYGRVTGATAPISESCPGLACRLCGLFRSGALEVAHKIVAWLLEGVSCRSLDRAASRQAADKHPFGQPALNTPATLRDRTERDGGRDAATAR
jgi:hypothetical protein